MPGVQLDAYGDFLVLGMPADLPGAEEALDAAAALGARGVYLKRRPREASKLSAAERASLAPEQASRGEDAPETLVVRERGLVFGVRLGAGMQTGLFLDQRDNRALIEQLAAGARVLNLFAYTGAFTVAAARGGARATLSVDVSAPALGWAADNLRHNGFEATSSAKGEVTSAAHVLLRVDALRWLSRARQRCQQGKAPRFDLVVLDPPSYATTKTSRFVAERDYPALAADALGCLEPGGRLLACINHQRVDADELAVMVRTAAQRAGVRLRSLAVRALPADFRPHARATGTGPRHREGVAELKSVLAETAPRAAG